MRRRRDAGVGLLGSVAGLLVFLALLLFATQTLIALHTRSVVAEAAYEGARAVAGARVDHTDPAAVAAAEVEAEVHVRELLGRIGDRADIDWTGTTNDSVRLTVTVTPPSFLWSALRGPGRAIVERRVTVRVEDLR